MSQIFEDVVNRGMYSAIKGYSFQDDMSFDGWSMQMQVPKTFMRECLSAVLLAAAFPHLSWRHPAWGPDRSCIHVHSLRDTLTHVGIEIYSQCQFQNRLSEQYSQSCLQQ